MVFPCPRGKLRNEANDQRGHSARPVEEEEGLGKSNKFSEEDISTKIFQGRVYRIRFKGMRGWQAHRPRRRSGEKKKVLKGREKKPSLVKASM